jgi:hypothetical protein
MRVSIASYVMKLAFLLSLESLLSSIHRVLNDINRTNKYDPDYSKVIEERVLVPLSMAAKRDENMANLYASAQKKRSESAYALTTREGARSFLDVLGRNVQQYIEDQGVKGRILPGPIPSRKTNIDPMRRQITRYR